MTVGQAVLLGLIRRYLAAVMDPTVTLLEVHKLMYFQQEAGEPLRLQYEKAPYGPYARNLRHVLSHIEGHFITGYEAAEARPDKPLELNIQAADKAVAFLENHRETQERFDRVANLIQGFETPFCMELLSAVHWVVMKEGAGTVEETVSKVHHWNKRKLMFKPQHIEIATGRLSSTKWFLEYIYSRT
ncbi:MAG: Appr-1-p processing protein [Cyanobacteria bacterium P01_F01_bin.53]